MAEGTRCPGRGAPHFGPLNLEPSVVFLGMYDSALPYDSGGQYGLSCGDRQYSVIE